MVMHHKNLTFCEIWIAFFPACEISSSQAPRTPRCRGGHLVMGRCLGAIWAAGTLACTAAVYAAETTQRTDPVDPICLQRDAPPEKCVINDGLPPPPRLGGAGTLPPGATTPPAPVPNPPLDAGSPRPPGAPQQPDAAAPPATPTTPAPTTPATASPAPTTGAGAPSAGPAATDGAAQRSAPRGRTASGGHPGGSK